MSIIHAQQADRSGNVQLWGIVGVQKEAILAADRAIVTVEEIVDELTPRPSGVVLPAGRSTPCARCPAVRTRATRWDTRSATTPSTRRGTRIARDRDTFTDWIDRHIVSTADFAEYRRSVGLDDNVTATIDHRPLTIELKGNPMAIAQQTMTDEQRKSVALEYLKAFDNGGVTSTGDSILSLFATDAQVMFPKWGIATGRDEIGQMFGDVGGTIKQIVHHYSNFNWIMTGTDVFACEGTSHGEHEAGPWRAGVPEWGAGRWCDVFEVRDFLIQRCFIYLDPDYAGGDKGRYPWITD